MVNVDMANIRKLLNRYTDLFQWLVLTKPEPVLRPLRLNLLALPDPEFFD
jgi:hypothetical protein